MITFHLNKRSGVPPYLQIVQQVKQAMQLGVLQKGDRLPAVKEVVGMVVINPNTVFKAYRELENQGFVEGRTGSGTFVRALPTGPPPAMQAALAAKLHRWVVEARTAQLDDEAIEALVRAAISNQKGDSDD